MMPTEWVVALRRHDLHHPDGRSFFVYGASSGTLDQQSADTGHDPAHLHRRFDLLTGTWVLISPARNSRPGGQILGPADSGCPLCPGGPELPWPYDLAVFDNRFPSLSLLAPPVNGALMAPSTGRCQVVVYTSDHDGSVASLSPTQLVSVVAVWRDRASAVWTEGHRYVMVFENRGAAVGATLSHPHGQLYAFGHLPPITAEKVEAHQRFRSEESACLGCRLVAQEAGGPRELVHNDSWVIAVPFAARWPYEVHVRARRHGLRRLADLTDGEVVDLAAAIRTVVRRFDGLFGFELPYVMCVQESPAFEGDAASDWHLHVEFLPPHRSADRLKVRASVETSLGVFINDTLPEQGAEALRAVSVDDVVWPTAVPLIEPA
jgi:UDPglucose--hexose-1-phosphate uridylyltransferase